MANRREFLQIGIAAASVWPLTGSTGAIARSNNTDSEKMVPFYKAVFDSRYADSRMFADQMTSQNISVQAIEGDITPFWYKELDAVWKKEPVAVAGMTAHGPLFCLDQLAREHGMKVVYRGTHKPISGNIIQHSLSAPEMMIAKSRAGDLALAGLDSQWPPGVAKLMQECPMGHTAIDKTDLMMPITAMRQNSPAVDIFMDPLISWIIAPAKKA